MPTVATNARLEQIADAAHAANLDQPRAFNAAVRGFLEEVGGPRKGA